MEIPDDYERNDNKDEKFNGGGEVDRPPAPRLMAQTGTLDPSVMGRTKRSLSAYVPHDLAKTTLLVPAPEGLQPLSSTTNTTTVPRRLPFGGIKIAIVATSLT